MAPVEFIFTYPALASYLLKLKVGPAAMSSLTWSSQAVCRMSVHDCPGDRQGSKN